MYDSEEEIEEFTAQPLPNLQLKLQNPISEKIKCDTLCIGIYGISSLYVSSLVDIANMKPINRINFQRPKQKALASVYENNNGVVFIIFQENFEKMKEIHFSQFIQSNFNANRVILFTSKPKGILEEQTTGNLKYIATSKQQLKEGLQKYPEGLQGPEADLIQWGQIIEIPIMCYIGLFAEYQVKRQQIEETFGVSSGQYGLQSKYDLTNEIKKFNMVKYANKLYL